MPRFYFEVREGTRFASDEDGTEFPNLDAAEREAIEAAADIGRDRLPRGEAREVTVEVHDETRTRVLTVKISLEIDRVRLMPEALRTVDVPGLQRE